MRGPAVAGIKSRRGGRRCNGEAQGIGGIGKPHHLKVWLCAIRMRSYFSTANKAIGLTSPADARYYLYMGVAGVRVLSWTQQLAPLSRPTWLTRREM